MGGKGFRKVKEFIEDPRTVEFGGMDGVTYVIKMSPMMVNMGKLYGSTKDFMTPEFHLGMTREEIDEQVALIVLEGDDEKRLGGFNGYLILDREPRIDIHKIDVHGGVTYDSPYEDGFIIGFDTGHSGSNHVPRFSIAWMKEELRRMLESVRELEGA
jgi:hypothetical protein